MMVQTICSEGVGEFPPPPFLWRFLTPPPVIRIYPHEVISSLLRHYSLSATFLNNSSPQAHLHVVGMLRFMFDINQPNLPAPFYSVLMSISVFMAFSTVFHSINSPNNSPFSHSVLPILSPLYWTFQLYIS